MTKLTGLGLAVNRTHTAKSRTYDAIYLFRNVAGTGPADVLVLVGDASGKVIGELPCELVGVAWKLNDYGQARLNVPVQGLTSTDLLLRFGNRLLIQFGNGLPSWGGVIDVPRKWSDRQIEVVAYSGERLFTDRITGLGRYFTNATAGEIFRALVVEATPFGVDPGQIWSTGQMHSPDYHYTSLYDVVTKSLGGKLENSDWNVSTSLTGGRIRFQANYYSRRGIDHGRRLALIEGVNMTDADLNEQGPLVNDWFIAGAGTGWEEETRLFSRATDPTSVGWWGLRQRGEIRVDVTSQETLDNVASVSLLQSKDPRGVVSPTVLDLAPARFYQYDVGDSIWLEQYSAGFDGYASFVRIRAREFLPQKGTCALVVI